MPWTVRALGALIVLQLVASGAAAVTRPVSGRPAALLRSVPAPTTTTTSAPEEPTSLLPATSTTRETAAPTTRPAPAPPPASLPTDPMGRLAARINAALGGVRSCLVVKDGDATVYNRAADLALAPASTQKLLVAAAALERLGPDYRFETTVVAPAAPHDGAVDALWLVGGGDPLLATPEYAAHLAGQPRSAGTPVTTLASLADQLVAAGVHSVGNGVHGDDSRYSGPQWLPGWKPIYRDEADVPLLSALTVDGGLDHWDPSEVIAADPTARAATELARLLQARGAAAGGAQNEFRPGNGVVLARVPSAPLSQVVASMLRSSDNLAAELIVRELDREAGGSGTTIGGLAVVVSAAQRLGIPTGGLHLGDGSGLDPANRVSCGSLLAALDLGNRRGFDAISTGLPVAARSGTLVKRFAGTPLAGHLAAKTGWINCAAAMTGRIDFRRPVRFSLIVNGPCDWNSAEALEDRTAFAIAGYPE